MEHDLTPGRRGVQPQPVLLAADGGNLLPYGQGDRDMARRSAGNAFALTAAVNLMR